MTPKRPTSGSHQSAQGHTPALLIVEDMSQVAEVLRRTFENAGYEVFICSDPLKAKGILGSHSFDVVLTDIRMPGMSGIDLLREVKDRYADLPVLLMTGYADVDSASKAVQLGAEAYLTKPLDLNYVQHCVEQAIEKRRLILDKKQQDRRLFEKLAELSGRVRVNLVNMLKMLRDILRDKDPYFIDHGNRVAALAGDLATELGLNAATVAETKAAAVIMDIGMITAEARVSPDPIPVTQRDMAKIREHVRQGHQILASVLTNQRLLRLVECHHERWDGKGLRGLSGEQIPIGARILAVCDAYDAMVSPRPHGKALVPARAKELLKTASGEHFDPEVVRLFLAEKTRPARKPAQVARVGKGAASNIVGQLSEAASAGRSPAAAPAPAKGTGGGGVEDRRSSPPEVTPCCTLADLTSRFEEAGELGATSFVAREVASLCRASNTELAEVVKFAEQDPVIASRILRVANSSMYSRGRRVSELHTAINNIGLRPVGEIVTGMLAVDQFGGNPDNLFIRPEWFWEHAIACGVLARAFCDRLNITGDEDAFLAGLLHDLGRAAFDQFLPDEYHPLLQKASEQGLDLVRMEKAALSISHAGATGMLLGTWGLGAFTSLVIHHHKPLSTIQTKVRKHADKAACVALANAVIKAASVGFGGSTVLDPTNKIAQHFGLTYPDLVEMLEDVQADVASLKACFMAQSATELGQSYRDTIRSTCEDLGRGLFIDTPGKRPDEVELFLDTLGLLRRADDAAGGDPPRFAVCRAPKKATWRDCVKRIQSEEHVLALEALPTVLLIDEEFQAPTELSERHLVLVGVPTSTKLLLDAIRAAIG